MADDKETSSNTNQSTNQSQSQQTSGFQTVTPQTPTWLSGLYQDVAGQGQNLIDNPATASMYAPERSSDLQTTANAGAAALPGVGAGSLSQAIQQLTNLSGSSAPQAAYTPYSAATANPFAAGTVSGAGPTSAQISAYMDPSVDAQVSGVTADLNHQLGIQRAANAGNATLAGAFGGSGAALENAATNDAADRTLATTTAGIRSGAYTQALGAAQSDANRATTAQQSNQSTALATILANLTGQNSAAAQNAQGGLSASEANQQAQEQTLAQQIAAATSLGSLSAQQQQAAQAQVALQAQLGQVQQQQDVANTQFPLSLLQQVAALMSGIPVGALSGSTTFQDQTGTGTATGTQTGTSNGSQTGFGISGFGVGPKGFTFTGG